MQKKGEDGRDPTEGEGPRLECGMRKGERMRGQKK